MFVYTFFILSQIHVDAQSKIPVRCFFSFVLVKNDKINDLNPRVFNSSVLIVNCNRHFCVEIEGTDDFNLK